MSEMEIDRTEKIVEIFDRALHSAISAHGLSERDQLLSQAFSEAQLLCRSAEEYTFTELQEKATRLRIHGVRLFSDRRSELEFLKEYFDNIDRPGWIDREKMLKIIDRLMAN